MTSKKCAKSIRFSRPEFLIHGHLESDSINFPPKKTNILKNESRLIFKKNLI